MEKRKVIGLCISFLIIGIIIGSITMVIAESINSDEILYDNNSVSSDTTVKEALDSIFNIIDHSNTGFSLLKYDPQYVSTELVAGLYRYQGSNVDNYICFGTLNKDTCVNNPNTFLYRIIGFNENGQLKIIKNTNIGKYSWNSSAQVTWPNSNLFNGLNGSYFLTNLTYVPEGWSDKIATTPWQYGSVSRENLNASALNVMNTELSGPTVNAKIGLLYLHDFYYGMPGGNNCSEFGNPSVCEKSWIYYGNEDYTITALDPASYNIWKVYYNSHNWVPSVSGVGFSAFVRPVFFLKIGQYISSGSGTFSDPYILGDVS